MTLPVVTFYVVRFTGYRGRTNSLGPFRTLSKALAAVKATSGELWEYTEGSFTGKLLNPNT